MKSRSLSIALVSWLVATMGGAARADEPTSATFLGTPDDTIIQRLCEQPVARLELNRAGTTVKFKAVMADGTRASLRPAQSNEAGYFKADVAAYRLSRALGLGTVAPACIRTVTREQIFGAAGANAIRERLEKQLQWSADGATIAASMVIWVDKVRSAGLDGDVHAWRPLLSQAAKLDGAAPAAVARAAEGGRLIAFDYLIDNWDRWSGSNTFRVGANGPFVWLDNAAGFGHYGAAAARRNEKQFAGVERFSRALVAALRRTDEAALARALAAADLPERSLHQLAARRTALLRRVDELIARHGEARVLCFD
jgi:hypothetical protein